MSTKRSSLYVGLTLTTTLLSGCFFEPPACSDTQVAQTLKRMVLEQAAKAAFLPFASDKNKALVERFTSGLQFSLDRVVSNGYSREAKSRQCAAQLIVEDGQRRLSGDIVYKIQSIEGKDDSVVWLEPQNSVISALSLAEMMLVTQYSHAGMWNGTYRCGGVDGATSGPRGPFEQQVAMTIEKGDSGKLERTTQGGGVETLNVSLLSGETTGSGANSPEDRWNVKFKGKASELDYAAQGSLVATDGEVLRQCELRLKQTPITELPAGLL